MAKRHVQQPRSSIRGLQAELRAQQRNSERSTDSRTKHRPANMDYAIGRLLVESHIADAVAELTESTMLSFGPPVVKLRECNLYTPTVRYAKAQQVGEYLRQSGEISGNGTEYDVTRLLGKIGSRLASADTIHDKPLRLRLLGIKVKSFDAHHQRLVQLWADGQRRQGVEDELTENRFRLMREKAAVQKMLGFGGVPSPPGIGVAKVRIAGEDYAQLRSQLRAFGQQFVGQEITLGPLQAIPVDLGD